MTSAPHQKFNFDTDFDNAGGITHAVERPKRLYPLEEVEAIRREAFEQGRAEAHNGLVARQSDALQVIAHAASEALPRLAEVAHEHRVGSAELALACGRAIADAALERFPEAALVAAIESLAREIESSPRLVVSVSPDLAEGLATVLAEAAQAIGFAGAIQVRGDGNRRPAAFHLDFGDGTAEFNPALAADRVAAVLTAALAAEGLHAEPLTPGSEG